MVVEISGNYNITMLPIAFDSSEKFFFVKMDSEAIISRELVYSQQDMSIKTKEFVRMLKVHPVEGYHRSGPIKCRIKLSGYEYNRWV